MQEPGAGPLSSGFAASSCSVNRATNILMTMLLQNNYMNIKKGKLLDFITQVFFIWKVVG